MARITSANNQSIAVSVIDQSKISETAQRAKTKKEIMRKYTEQQKNISMQQQEVDRDKLIEQNIKLKEQIKALVIHMDQVVKNHREKQRQAKRDKLKKEEAPDNLKILEAQELQIKENSNLAKQLHKKLQTIMEVTKVQEKEDQVKFKQKELDTLLKEQQSQAKIAQRQNSVLDSPDTQEQQKQLNITKQQLTQEQRIHRELVDEINKKEKEVQALHNQKVTKQKAIQQIEQKIKDRKGKPDQPVNEGIIKQIENDIKELTKQKEIQTAEYSEKMKQFEAQKKELKGKLDEKIAFQIKLEREIKITSVYIHEVKRHLKKEDINTSQRTSKPNLSVPKKARTPDKRADSAKSERSIKSIHQIVEIKEEQFEETIIEQKLTPKQKEILKQQEIQREQLTQIQQQIEKQQQLQAQLQQQRQTSNTDLPQPPAVQIDQPPQEQKPKQIFHLYSIYKKPTFNIKPRQQS